MSPSQSIRLFHISENGHINTFKPRSSPSEIKDVSRHLVFAISERLLHNYLLPRDCPRVTYYMGEHSSVADREIFFGQSTARFVIAVEERWLRAMQETTLYCYEFPTEHFELLDAVADYYISYDEIQPISAVKLDNPLEELGKRREVELRVLPEIRTLAATISCSTLNYSLIRMRNATLVL